MIENKIISGKDYDNLIDKITNEIEKLGFCCKASYPNKNDLIKIFIHLEYSKYLMIYNKLII